MTRGKPKTPEGRSIAKLWVYIRQGRISEARVYELGSEIAGRGLIKGFGLSTLVLAELMRLIDHVKVEIGERPGTHRRGKRRWSWETRPEDNIVQMASIGALQMIKGVQEELHLSDPELAGVIWRATRQQTRRVKTAHEARVTIEALWAMRDRRLKAAAHADQEAENDSQIAG